MEKIAIVVIDGEYLKVILLQGLLKYEQCLELKSNKSTICCLGFKAVILRQYLIWLLTLFMVLEAHF